MNHDINFFKYFFMVLINCLPTTMKSVTTYLNERSMYNLILVIVYNYI